MNTKIIFLLLLVAVNIYGIKFLDSEIEEFDQYIVSFGKSYPTKAEYLRRFENFKVFFIYLI